MQFFNEIIITVFQFTQRATENHTVCHAWHACRRLPTAVLHHLTFLIWFLYSNFYVVYIFYFNDGDSGLILLRCDALSLGESFPTFRRFLMPSSAVVMWPLLLELLRP
jgi:hypothetical protein